MNTSLLSKIDLSILFSEEMCLKLLPSSEEFAHVNIGISNVHKLFSCVHCYKVDDSYFSVGNVIKQGKDHISLRKFKVDSYTNCNLSLIQKDQKFYRKSGYEYVWIRLMIVMKDIDGYRWINGSYSKGKIVSFSCSLSPG